MAVYYYKENALSSGFVGWRVVANTDTKKYRQKYFSIKQYTYNEGKRLAMELDAKWQKSRQFDVKTDNDWLRVTKVKSGIAITDSLTLRLSKYRKKGNEYWVICFHMYMTKQRGTLQYAIGKDINDSFERAVDAYMKDRDMDERCREILLSRLPSRSEITAHIRSEHNQRDGVPYRVLLDKIDTAFSK